MIDLSEIRWLSFDCYGTLIDWESGILAAMRPILAFHGIEVSNDEILRAYSELEPAEQRRSYRPYKEILKAIVAGFGERYSFRASLEEMESLPQSLASWKPFPDTHPALERLKQRFRLAVISNIDDDLFAQTAKHFPVEFDQVVTAQQAQSYKPAHRNFEFALQQMGANKKELLHVAESLFHDVAPCNQLGIRCVWVNRRGARPTGASRIAEAKPELEVPTLGDLCGRLP